MSRKNKPGQFTTEVHETKERAFQSGKIAGEVSMGQLVKEAEDRLREEGRQEIIDQYRKDFVCLKKESYDQAIDDAYKDGHANGFAIGNKMTGDARFQQGVETGVRLGYSEGKAVGIEETNDDLKATSFTIGVIFGSAAMAFGGLIGMATGWLARIVF